MITIDSKAPLQARKQIVINTPVEKVWALETDINHWSTWQPGVSVAMLEGPLQAGTVFRWRAMGLRITSRLQEVEPPRRISWTGDSIGSKAIHVWDFEAREDGTTLVTCAESLSGWFASLVSKFQPRFLEKDMEKSLQVLKVQAEKA
jgi:uncharacterized protein YndB with AHSA1/START domain